MQAILSWIVTFLQKEWLSFLIFLIGVLVGFVLVFIIFLCGKFKPTPKKTLENINSAVKKAFIEYGKTGRNFNYDKLSSAIDGLKKLLEEIPKKYNENAKFFRYENVKFLNTDLKVCLDVTVYDMVTFVDNIITQTQIHIEEKILEKPIIEIAYLILKPIKRISAKESKDVSFAEIKQKLLSKTKKGKTQGKVLKPVKDKIIGFLFDKAIGEKEILIIAEELNLLYSGNIERRYKKDDENTALVVKEEAV